MKINISNQLKIKNFVDFVKNELSEKGGKLILRNKIANGENQDGEFCEKTNTIRCKKNNNSFYWLGVLAHEYAHFIQSSNKTKFWTNFQKNINKLNNTDDILTAKDSSKGENFSKKDREKIISSVIDMELECEKMALEFVKKFDLPINKEEYVILSNVIFYKYLYWAEYEIWPSFKPSSIKKWDEELIKKMKTFGSRLSYKNFSEIPLAVLACFKNT
jgi:hypothetical protein